LSLDPLHQFQVHSILPLPTLAGFNIDFTNSSLWMLIGAVVSTGFLTYAMRQKAIIPTRAQAAAEMAYNMIASMLGENCGEEGKRFFPLVFTLFIMVLMGNVLGLLPYSFTYTSHIVVTFTLAIIVFLTVFAVGFIRNGVGFLKLFVPSGLPAFAIPLVVPIELISFLARPLTLSVRLFANMMAGHLILKVFAGFSLMLLPLGIAGLAMGVLPVVFNALMIAFEVIVALVHTYIFTILTCIYLKDAVASDHH
jgi:F-type H+-transporting ATPase subunit a